MWVGADGAARRVEEGRAHASGLAAHEQHRRDEPPRAVQHADAQRSRAGRLAGVVGPLPRLAEVAVGRSGDELVPQAAVFNQRRA